LAIKHNYSHKAAGNAKEIKSDERRKSFMMYVNQGRTEEELINH
jgi:hypothetical protein